MKKRDPGGYKGVFEQYVQYSPELARQICDLIAEGFSQREIEKMDGMPTRMGMYKMRAENPEFAAMYKEAVRQRAHDRFAEIYDFVRSKEAKANPAWARVVMDAEKWSLARMDNGYFGDKITQELTGVGGSSLVVQFVKAEQKPAE